ncbi:flagellar hook-associated protein FlgL [Fusibacter sp. 3D3]|uniref:flagellar hook-associated protein FlgL n=1 Tax=Fusibacter sp. 3D3 TaxID=1048380 RepID=UPI000852C1A3|nr:flagellar hook-associated protein FlgL [Fusibacter sp. 3D3]GAU75672.1 flagellar hook-associated protein FlgL [Fusibacter sp. 3D3]
MRVTNTMLIKDMLWNANRNLVSMSEKQTQLSTGKRIHRPSDDPVGITKVLKYQSDISELEMFKTNAKDAQGVLDMTESALTGIKDMLQRIRELAVQSANGTLTDEQTSKVAAEVEQLKKELIISGNSSMAGKYLFSGLETDSKLFNEDGTYNINLTSQRLLNKDTMKVQVAVGEFLDTGTYPTDVFGIVQLDTVISNGISYASGAYQPATHSALKGNFDLTLDYAVGPTNLDVTINGTDVFAVDTTELVGTALKPISKQSVIEAYQSAQFGTVKLGDVANVYFNTSDELVIEAKSYGTGTVSTMAVAVSAGYTPSFTAGVNVNGATSTKTNATGAFGLSADYTADNLDITVNGVTYSVDVSTLDGTTTPLTEAQVISAFHNATDGSGHLSDVATVYFSGGNLVVEPKAYGSASTVSMAGPSALYTPVVTAGTNGDGIALSGKNPVYDADVAAQSGIQTFVVKYNGHSETIKINMEGITTVAALKTEMQSSLDSKFPPAGTIVVKADNGTTIDFTTTGVNDGSKTTLEVDSVQATESKLMTDLEDLIKGLNDKDDAIIEGMITKLDKHLDQVITSASVVGGKTNRLTFISSRIEENILSFTELLSNTQDIDYAETILYFKSLESIYKASLSVGAKVIQPTLVDFIQ